MAAAPNRRIDPYAVTSAPRAPRQRPVAITGGASRIRWDRVGRMAILTVLIIVALLYVGPLSSIWAARGEAAGRRAEVAKLRQENRELRVRRTALEHGGALAAEARRLGMVKKTERPFVVGGLPKGP